MARACAAVLLALGAKAGDLQEDTVLMQLSPSKASPLTGAWISHGGACRLDTHDRSSDGYGSVVVKQAYTLESCKNFCTWSKATCWGIEYSLKSSRCEIWQKPIGYTVKNSAFDCISYISSTTLQKIASMGFSSFGTGTACRAGTHDDTYYGKGAADVKSAASLETCKALCADAENCHGIEYDGTDRCEIWTIPIGTTVPNSGYECFSVGTSAAKPLPTPAPTPGRWASPILPTPAPTPGTCDRDVGGDCSWWYCDTNQECMDSGSWHGFSKHCVCKPGYCVVNGVCVSK